MKHLSKVSQSLFDSLIEGLKPGEDRIFNNDPEAYMALHVNRLTESTFSLAHYFEQNGDLVPDPDMEFWKGPDGKVYPVAIQNAIGTHRRSVWFENGQPVRFSPRAQKDLKDFATMWLSNIRFQQSIKPKKAA